MTNLRLSIFTDPKKPHKQFTCLEAKAAETKHILPCLLEVLIESLPEGELIHRLASFNEIIQHFDGIDLFPTEAEKGLVKGFSVLTKI